MEREAIVRISKSGITTLPMVFSEEILKDMAKRVATTDNEIYKAKWTANGLIYTHKMNAKGEFEEIKSQEQIKAEAFDVLKELLQSNNSWHIELGDWGDGRKTITIFAGQEEDYEFLDNIEQYEILKKAGLE